MIDVRRPHVQPLRSPSSITCVRRPNVICDGLIFGVMIESFLVAGRQEISDRSQMTFGQSVTDGCLAWDTTVPVLEELADSVRKRRALG